METTKFPFENQTFWSVSGIIFTRHKKIHYSYLCHLKTGPFRNRTNFNHLKARLVPFSDDYSMTYFGPTFEQPFENGTNMCPVSVWYKSQMASYIWLPFECQKEVNSISSLKHASLFRIGIFD